MSDTKPKYVEGVSGDMWVTFDDLAGWHDALAMGAVSFCTECGCVVYRRDLHDAWHARIAERGR